MPIDTSAMQTIKSTLIGMPKGFWGDDFSTPQQGVPVIKTNNLNYDGNIDFSDLVYRKINRDEIGDNFLESGDLLIEKSGGTKTHSVGYVSFFDGPNGTFVCNNFILCLRPNQSVILPRYLFYSIRHLYECGSFEDCFSKTTGIQNLQISAYLSKKVPTVSKEIQFFQTRLLDAIENDILRDHSLLNSLQELIKSRFVSLVMEGHHVIV
jgi:type I restriction enzyme S subunit